MLFLKFWGTKTSYSHFYRFEIFLLPFIRMKDRNSFLLIQSSIMKLQKRYIITQQELGVQSQWEKVDELDEWLDIRLLTSIEQHKNNKNGLANFINRSISTFLRTTALKMGFGFRSRWISAETLNRLPKLMSIAFNIINDALSSFGSPLNVSSEIPFCPS